MSINENLVLEFAGLSTTAGALPSNTQEYLMVLGWSTALKNVHAGVKAGVMGTTKDHASDWTDEEISSEATRAGLTEWARDEATANALIAFYQREKFNDLLAGELSARRVGGGAPRLSPDEKLRRDIAIEFMVALAKEKGKELPKRSDTKNGGKEAFEELLGKALANANFAAKVEKEFKSRKKSATAAIEGLDDLFA